MIERVEFDPNARQETANSFDWYDSRQVGLGDQFLGALDDCIRLIRLHPDLSPSPSRITVGPCLRGFPSQFFIGLIRAL